MNASCNPSIASEMNARHKRPHRLALLATSPVVTGEAKIGEPRKGTETAFLPASFPPSYFSFKNQNPARGRNPFWDSHCNLLVFHLRTRTPQGDGNFRCIRIVAYVILYI